MAEPRRNHTDICGKPANSSRRDLTPDNGIVTVKSHHDYDETCRRLNLLIKVHALTLFADFDFTRDAKKVGLIMRPERLFIFGNPSSGTPLMQSAPGAALDLPLKILVSQDASGTAWLSYNSVDYLFSRHGIPAPLRKNVAGIEGLVAQTAGPEVLYG